VQRLIHPLFDTVPGAECYIPDFNSEMFDISHLPDDQIRGEILLQVLLLIKSDVEFFPIVNFIFLLLGIIQMVAPSIIESVKSYADLIRNRFPVKRVILYGSFARSTQRLDNDIDVAVILKSPPVDFLDTEAELFKLCRDIDIRIEPVIVEEEPDLSGFYEEISRYGTVIYNS
jgi:predicted nucleotidyltransferase